MSRRELLEALRRDAEAALAEVRAGVERDEAAMRASAGQVLAELQAAAAETLRVLITGERAAVVDAARRDAENQRLRSEERLAARLRTLAGEVLNELGRAGGAELWQRLAEDVPPMAWRRVVVAPCDVAAARQRFPEAAVEGDAQCDGGLMVEGAEGRIRVDNRLATRLDRGWDDLLPRLWHDPRLRAAREE